MWDENVDDDRAASSGAPVEPGVYGDLDDVDLSRQVVGLYSSGQSGSCPGWLRSVRTDDEGTVVITTTQDLQGGDGCTDDYRAYRVLVAIDRADVPSADAVEAARVVVDGNERLSTLVGTYPLAPGTGPLAGFGRPSHMSAPTSHHPDALSRVRMTRDNLVG